MREILEEMLDYPLEETHSVPGGKAPASGIEATRKQPIASSSDAPDSGELYNIR